MHLAEVACSNQGSGSESTDGKLLPLCFTYKQNYNSRINVLNLEPCLICSVEGVNQVTITLTTAEATGFDANLRPLTKKCKTNYINFTESCWLSLFLVDVRFTFLLEELVEGSKLLVPVDSVFYPGRISTFNEPDLWVWFEKMLV